MSLAPPAESTNVLNAEMECLRRSCIWLLILGALLIVVGLVAISEAFFATLATVLITGTLLMIGGVVEIVDAFLGRGWRGFWMHLLAGILYVVLGFLMVLHPAPAVAIFTLMLAAFFFVGGLSRILIALIERFYGWGWVLLKWRHQAYSRDPDLAGMARNRFVGHRHLCRHRHVVRRLVPGDNGPDHPQCCLESCVTAVAVLRR